MLSLKEPLVKKVEPITRQPSTPKKVQVVDDKENDRVSIHQIPSCSSEHEEIPHRASKSLPPMRPDLGRTRSRDAVFEEDHGDFEWFPSSPTSTTRRYWSDRPSTLSPARFCHQEAPKSQPLVHRHTTRRQRPSVLYAAFSGGAAADSISYPSRPDCIQCRNVLREREARNGTGLCDNCWNASTKECTICKVTLPLKQLQWGSELCVTCFKACDKACRMCDKSLTAGQLHWGTGLCDGCYNCCEKTCHMCQTSLKRTQLRWGTGLCDKCYSGVPKHCRICNNRMQNKQLRWSTGLCDTCYDVCEKSCHHCSSKIPLGSMHYQTGLCDTCYDKCDKNCKMCSERLKIGRLHLTTGLCDGCYGKCERNCKMCQVQMSDKCLHWGTGLCDSCYNACEKACKMCEGSIGFGSLHWGSGLCDTCYTSCGKTCKICQCSLSLGQLHWGTGLCDTCFDKCEKVCRQCSARIDVGQSHFGEGLCSSCHAKATDQPTSFTAGVKAAIGAQFVFYFAPAILQPSLYLQIQDAGYAPDAPTVFAAVLTTASIVAMIAPVPLGIWAEYRGEREVYFGIAFAGAVAAALFVCAPPSVLFALSWGVLNGPPAVRGVRAVFFAKHVAPQDLSRAAQLASTAGLAGGFLGPLASVAVSKAFGNGADGSWPDGFVVGAALAALSAFACSAWLRSTMPLDKKRGQRSRARAASLSSAVEYCERCENQLLKQEQKYATALCDHCWDNYVGPSYSFARFCKKVLFCFCAIACLLEVSMNAGVIAAFQPIVVSKFNWGNGKIAAVNFAGAGLSVVISLLMAHLRMPERLQTALAAGLYLVGVVLFTMPPLQEWRLVVGLMLGIKAQILFMAPFTSIFSRLIGRVRLTNRLTTALCLAPAIGAAFGTTTAPFFVAYAGTWYNALAALPALLSVIFIGVLWRLMEGKPPGEPSRTFSPGKGSDQGEDDV
eukprot:TRINITY_DN7154_c1_g5_i1.p1 TRINITY_DN7154_c1_g5~~TRINITY_DN7154_c1_g5_i1.p1  ORF type:complete len:946 (-),score=101.60 TRINITY_DN7154_c1_g5_i1:133-2970(-)